MGREAPGSSSGQGREAGPQQDEAVGLVLARPAGARRSICSTLGWWWNKSPAHFPPSSLPLAEPTRKPGRAGQVGMGSLDEVQPPTHPHRTGQKGCPGRQLGTDQLGRKWGSEGGEVTALVLTC